VRKAADRNEELHRKRGYVPFAANQGTFSCPRMIFALVLILGLSFLSCKTPPKADTLAETERDIGPEVPFAEEAAAGETAEIAAEKDAEIAGEKDEAQEAPVIDEPPGLENSGADANGSGGASEEEALAEPLYDVPETSPPPRMPEDAYTDDGERLPETKPEAPAFEEPPPVQEGPHRPPVQESPPIPPAREDAPPPPKAVEKAPEKKPEPPPPPAFIRPPEPLSPPPQREIAPAPVETVPPAENLPAPGDSGIAFSRTVRATVGQLVEVPFRGTGWVYLGETGARRGLAYDSRRLDPEGQSFIFRAEAAGTYFLKFYKQDFINDYIINDYVQVIVGEAPDTSALGWFNPPLDRGRVIAEPRWPEADVPEAALPQKENPAPASEPPAVPSRPPLAPVSEPSAEAPAVQPPVVSAETSAAEMPADAGPDEYVKQAKAEQDAGRAAQALSILDGMKAKFPALSDEALWLYGQLYEANSPRRDIRQALECYRKLVREYPQSGRVPGAQKRIAYLERYYFNIK
jgi:hypothetical protein